MYNLLMNQVRSSDYTAVGEHRGRILYLDVARVFAVSLVVVNHTDGPWMLSINSQSANWWLAVIAFFICKIAVPVFVMVSGALLLPRRDGYRKTAKRVFRIVVVLIVTSAFYYVIADGAHSIVDFADKLWHAKIRGHLWYLYMYIGLLAMMPLLQKLVNLMRKKDYIYFFTICFGVVCMFPMLAKIFPSAAYTSNFQLPLFGAYIGMAFAGHYIANVMEPIGKKLVVASVLAFLACLVFLVVVTDYYYDSRGGSKYLVMDDRTFTPIILMAICAFTLIKKSVSLFAPSGGRGVAFLMLKTVSACSFGIYLFHPFFIDILKPFFQQGCTIMPDVLALVLFQLGVFILSLIATWLMRLAPPIRRFL